MLLEGNLQGMQHLGLPVTNIDRSKAFYLAFGFTEVMQADLPGAPEAIHVSMLRKNDLTLELYQLSGEERRDIAGRRDGHIDHIALNVIDIEQAYAEIRAAGLEVVEAEAPLFLPFWSHGVRYFTVRGPDGEKVEFNQILNRSPRTASPADEAE
jgi:catechol 2,3-dioxygenase-like lactoylglutathione lyase family enzyme